MTRRGCPRDTKEIPRIARTRYQTRQYPSGQPECCPWTRVHVTQRDNLSRIEVQHWHGTDVAKHSRISTRPSISWREPA